MKIYWWQDGIHVKPETQEERNALVVLSGSLNIANLAEQILTGPEDAVPRSFETANK